MKRISCLLHIIRNCEIDLYYRTLYTMFFYVIHITCPSALHVSASCACMLIKCKSNVRFKKTNPYTNVFVKTLQPEDKDLDFKNGILKSDDQVAQFRACGVCLLDVDATSQDFVSEEQCAKLTYGGRQYHAVCANLWVNCVDSMLPALRLPELL